MERPESVHVPNRYPTATIFMDESGSKTEGGNFFVLGAVKTRTPGLLARELRDVLDVTGYRGEFKFSEITRGSVAAYYAAADALAASDARIVATVINRSTYSAPAWCREQWQVQAHVAEQMLVGCINKRELASVVMDEVQTPRGVSFEDELRRSVNNRLRSTSLVSAITVDSRSSLCVQLADLVAGAVLFERRRAAGVGGNANSHKAKVAARLLRGFDLSSGADCRTDRVNIVTLTAPPRRSGARKEQRGRTGLESRKPSPHTSRA